MQLGEHAGRVGGETGAHGLRPFLNFAGKSERKVVAVFGISPEFCDRAVRYVRANAAGIPVWLFATEPPRQDTAALCERVVVDADSMALVIEAQKQLWPRWLALAVSTWTGERGRWPVKLAPFAIPWFRPLFVNRNGDFFPADPHCLLRHIRRTWLDAAHSAWTRARDVRRGAQLCAGAAVAKCFLPAIRRMFQACHGSQALHVAVRDAGGMETAVFRYGDRRWDGHALETLCRASRVRRILFLEDGAQDDLPWVDDPRTFAVARQDAVRDRRPSLFAMAPFRALQEGEISNTLAPVSRAVLVDRAKLEALGIPKASTAATAWMLLFWKAAAAGWRSYAVGSRNVPRPLPDWPYDEAAFAAHALLRGDVRALGPREPDLSRGNIATVAALWQRTSRPVVLVLSPYVPWPLSHGGAVRMWNLCRTLSDRVDFVLACFREQHDLTDYDRLQEVFREVYVVDRDEAPLSDRLLPAQVREHGSRTMQALVAELASRVDILQVEFTHLAGFRDIAPQLPAILVEHDITFTLYRQLAEQQETGAAQQEYGRWVEFEHHWLRAYDRVWTMSEADRAVAVAAGSPAAGTDVVANGVDLERFAPSSAPPAMEVLYVGSFRHLPNIIGFRRLCGEVMPRVWNRLPEVRLRVVAGPEPERYWRELTGEAYPRSLDARIAMHAFVADLRPLYAGAAVVAAPLEVSAGTNIKVLEAMACGKAVVTTPVGCAGLGLRDGVDAMIRADAGAFAEAVAQLLADPERRDATGRQARRTAESRFGWEAAARMAYESYMQLIAARPAIRRLVVSAGEERLDLPARCATAVCGSEALK